MRRVCVGEVKWKEDETSIAFKNKVNPNCELVLVKTMTAADAVAQLLCVNATSIHLFPIFLFSVSEVIDR